MAQSKKSISFNEYKSIKDEIIEISEQRYENILARRLNEFKKELMNDLEVRFNAIEKRLTFLTCFLPFFIALLMTVFRFIK